MKRTQHLTTSQPLPMRRVARPCACPLGVVASAASAANDHRIGPFDGRPVKLGARRTGMLAGAAVDSACRALQHVEAGVDSIMRNAAKGGPAWTLPRNITVDNGKEFYGTEMAEFYSTLRPQTANTADKRTRGAK